MGETKVQARFETILLAQGVPKLTAKLLPFLYTTKFLTKKLTCETRKGDYCPFLANFAVRLHSPKELSNYSSQGNPIF